MAHVENDISKEVLEKVNITGRIERLQKVLDDIDIEIKSKNDIITRSEQETTKRNAIIERKQGQIDQLNKKLELLISQAGVSSNPTRNQLFTLMFEVLNYAFSFAQGVELGPLEIKIKSLQKSIDKENQLIVEQQGTWLREQGELVRLTKEKDSQTTNLNLMRKQLTIMAQRKLRIDSER